MNRSPFGVQSMVPHVLAALGRTHDPANVRQAVALAARRPASSVQPRPHLRRRRRDARRLAAHARRGASPSSPPHVSAYGLTVEPGTPLAADPARHPDDDDQADKYVAGRRAARRRPGWRVRDLQLGPARPRVPAQPPLLDPGRLPRVRVRRPLPPARPAVVERAHARALHRAGRPRAIARGGGRGARRGDAAARGAAAGAATRAGVPASALDVDELDGLVERDGERVVLTRAGRLLANEVAVRLR